ncbi:hypothetical protein EBQ90_04425 [bacterium]|nr:hypothetical protein [bacterium]
MKPVTSKIIIWALCVGLSCLSGRGFGADAPTEQDDRGTSQNGASAMAMAAAAMQQVMCMKMMADAVAENNSEKMTMASMMCAQAAATAANAAQNKEGAKKVTLNNQMPSAPSFEKPNLETQPKADDFSSVLDGLASKETPKTEPQKEDAQVTFAKNEDPKEGSVFQEDKKFDSSGSPLIIPDVKPGPSSTINLKDSPNDSRAGLLGGSNTFSSLNNSNGLTPSNKQMMNQVTESVDAKRNKKGTSKNGESGAGAEGGNMEDLMARYMNGGAGFGGISSAGLSGGIIDLAFGLQVTGQRPKTIFEFASEQYQQARSSGKALHRKPLRNRVPSRQIASE